MRYRTIIAALPLLLLGLTATNQAFAWDLGSLFGGGYDQGYHITGACPGSECYQVRYGEGISLGQPLGPGSYSNGYYAGQQELWEGQGLCNLAGGCTSSGGHGTGVGVGVGPGLSPIQESYP